MVIDVALIIAFLSFVFSSVTMFILVRKDLAERSLAPTERKLDIVESAEHAVVAMERSLNAAYAELERVRNRVAELESQNGGNDEGADP